MCSSLASEGGAEAIGANPTDLQKLGLWQHIFGKRYEIREEEGGGGSMSRGKGRTTPLRGGRFLTCTVLRGQSFPLYWQKVKVMFWQM